MRIRIYNVRILTMEENVPIFRGEIQIEDGRIRCIIKNAKENEIALSESGGSFSLWDREIDGEGNLVMPGFKDAHTHSPMTFLRSLADDLPLQSWLQTVVFPAEAKLTKEDVYWLTLLAVMEYLTSGITAVFDMYFHRESVARAMKDSGFRTVFCGALNDFTESAGEIERDYERYNQEELLSFRLGFHAEYTTGIERLKQVAALAEKYKAPVYTHLAETKAEVESCKARNGMTPLAYLDSLGIFRYGGGAFHMVHLEDEDFSIAKKRGIFCVTNPASNLKLASGVAPVAEMMRRGIPVAIGTDGPASNNCLDMFREMFLTTGLQKVRQEDATAVPAWEVLKMATVNAATAMGLSDADVLQEGKRADLIMIDLAQPNMHPLYEESIIRNLVYSGSKQNVKFTMVNGRILYEDGKFHIGTDKEVIYHMVREVLDRTIRCNILEKGIN